MCEVTIAIALYNLEDYIEDSLKSALDQDFEDFEILVCDDCSTDHSLEVVKRVCENHVNGHKVRIISPEKNSKTAVIRNMGIDEAKGKYLFFLDGDDILAPGTISAMYEMMMKTHANFITGNLLSFEDCPKLTEDVLNNGKATHFGEHIIKEKYAIAKLLEIHHTNFYNVGLVNKLFDLNFIRKNNIRCLPVHGVVEDLYFASLCQLKTTSIATIKKATLYYRLREGSAVHVEYSKERVDLYLRIFNVIYEDLQKEERAISPEKLPVQLYYIITRRYLYGFITKDVLSSKKISRQDKIDYLKQISEIRKLNFTSNDLISRLNRIVYFLLQYRCRYWLIIIAVFIFRILGKK